MYLISVSELTLLDERARLKHIQNNTYIKLHHYVEDIKGFYPYIDELVSDVFKFKEEDIKEAKRRFKALRPELKTMVSVHIRCGSDYFLIKHQSRGTRSKDAFTCFFSYILTYLVLFSELASAHDLKSPLGTLGY